MGRRKFGNMQGKKSNQLAEAYTLDEPHSNDHANGHRPRSQSSTNGGQNEGKYKSLLATYPIANPSLRDGAKCCSGSEEGVDGPDDTCSVGARSWYST